MPSIPIEPLDDLSQRQLTLLSNRLDHAAVRLRLDCDQLSQLQQLLLPEEYAPPVDSRPATAPPGTSAKVTTMARRARLRLPLTSPADTVPIEDRPPGEFVLIVRTDAKNRTAAFREARRLLNHSGRCGLPDGCSVEVV